jgi:hypothetical protein
MIRFLSLPGQIRLILTDVRPFSTALGGNPPPGRRDRRKTPGRGLQKGGNGCMSSIISQVTSCFAIASRVGTGKPAFLSWYGGLETTVSNRRQAASPQVRLHDLDPSGEAVSATFLRAMSASRGWISTAVRRRNGRNPSKTATTPLPVPSSQTSSPAGSRRMPPAAARPWRNGSPSAGSGGRGPGRNHPGLAGPKHGFHVSGARQARSSAVAERRES